MLIVQIGVGMSILISNNMNPFTKHPNETENPQGYWKHGLFALVNSMILIYAGLIGVVHAVFPFVFQFTTSTIVIKSFNKLVNSRRHKAELQRELPSDMLNSKYKD